MSEREAILFANEAFYRAFADADMPAMNDLWTTAIPVACIHPGWPALTDREAVMESWRRIFGGGNPPDIRCDEPKVYQHGDMAFVVCYETVGAEVLAATNVFVRDADGQRWRIAHHQAGATPIEAQPAPPTSGSHRIN